MTARRVILVTKYNPGYFRLQWFLLYSFNIITSEIWYFTGWQFSICVVILVRALHWLAKRIKVVTKTALMIKESFTLCLNTHCLFIFDSSHSVYAVKKWILFLSQIKISLANNNHVWELMIKMQMATLGDFKHSYNNLMCKKLSSHYLNQDVTVVVCTS